MKYGTIFDIKQFAVYDGPGLRQTVFFKGCPLSCSWCHNPEGQCVAPELMVSLSSCLHCERCKKVCPSPNKCTACGKCIEVCPLHLRRISGEKISSRELEKRIRKDADIYARNNGGVTFSGGEPFLQSEFLLECLYNLSDLHKCIETSGYVDKETYREAYNNLDFIIQDFKIFDTSEHIKYIGKSNEKILDNIAYLRDGTKPFVIRIPLIPGITDTERNYREIGLYLKGSRSLYRIELLPYLTVAGAKYSMVGRKYEPDFDVNAKPAIRQDIFEDFGIRSIVL